MARLPSGLELIPGNRFWGFSGRGFAEPGGFVVKFIHDGFVGSGGWDFILEFGGGRCDR
jgi:hypothetical protein